MKERIKNIALLTMDLMPMIFGAIGIPLSVLISYSERGNIVNNIIASLLLIASIMALIDGSWDVI